MDSLVSSSKGCNTTVSQPYNVKKLSLTYISRVFRSVRNNEHLLFKGGAKFQCFYVVCSFTKNVFQQNV